MTDHWTSEEFEAWLAGQLALGWRVINPDSIDKIRAEFRRGATLAPFRQISTNSPSPLPGPLSS